MSNIDAIVKKWSVLLDAPLREEGNTKVRLPTNTTATIIESKATPVKKLYVDLDCVLVDFLGGLAKVPEVKDKYKTADEYFADAENSRRISESLPASFWANLDWTKDGKRLWDYIKDFDVAVLTAPVKSEACYTGKRQWVKKNLGLEGDDVIIEKHKYKYAGPGKILIDDMPYNIEPWREKGGIGILHKNTTDTIYVLKILGYDKTK